MTFDLWDFSGCSKYFNAVYSCFNCENSLHVAVFSISSTTSEIIKCLSDIQALSSERVPLVVVFTHLDTLTRDEKEEVKRKRTDWLKYNLTLNEKAENSPSFALLSSTMSQTVKSLQDTEHRHSFYEAPQRAFEVQEYSSDVIPLMPYLLCNPFFVSNQSGDGMSQLRKTLYRIGAGLFRTTLPSLLMLGLEIPTVYVQIENLIRQLKGHLKNVKTDGEIKPFYTFSELKDRLRRPIKQLDITGGDFQAALRFLHEVQFTDYC